MCVVSMIGDHFQQHIPQQYPSLYAPMGPTRQEFEALKIEVQQMHELLKRAKRYDEDNGEPNCEMEEKVATLKKVAKMVGVDLSDVFP